MKLRLKKFLAAALALCLVLTGCDLSSKETEQTPMPIIVTPTPSPEITPPPEPTPQKIGISLPTQNTWRWEREGSLMRQLLEEKGFDVDLRFAGNDKNVQISQVKEMIESGCDLLIITPIDGSVFRETLEPTDEKGVSVISYDWIIRESYALDYHIMFAYMDAGATHIKYIEEALDLKNSSGSFNIELFAGSPDDSGPFANFLLKDLVAYLKPYLDSGNVIIPSGQTEISDAGILSYRTENAKVRMEELIASQGYGPGRKRLDAAICASDSIALGVTQALLETGYTEENFPIVTGIDCDLESVRNILKGTQAMSLWRNTARLAERAVIMAESILNGEEPEVNWLEGYHNDVKIVPTYACSYDICTRENYKELLIDSGYYTQEEIDG